MSKHQPRGRRPIPVVAVRQCPDGCGWCCDPVAIPFSQNDALLLNGRMNEEDRRWILEDLTAIPRREGIERASYLTQGGKTSYADSPTAEPRVDFTFFYECRHFDRDTRACSNYAGRPPMCRGYPWYGKRPDPSKTLPGVCVFLEDIGVTPAELPE